MVATRKRKRAKSQRDGKRGDADDRGGTMAKHPPQSTAPDPRPQTKKVRIRHPSKMQLPVSSPQSLSIHHPVLSIYFPILLLLRTFLEQSLSFSSKSRGLKKLAKINKETEPDLSFLLDTTLVGLEQLRTQNATLDIEDATQSSGGSRPTSSSQSQVVDIVLHTLFSRSLSLSRPNSRTAYGKPNNILAQGYRENTSSNRHTAQGFNLGPCGIDVVNFYPNTHVGTLKSPIWAKLFGILGEDIMIDLLLNTSIFLLLDGNLCDVTKANYYQLAGPPLSDFLNNPAPVAPTAKASLQRSSVAAPGTRSVGAPLKRPVSEIEGTSAKLIDKKIKPNRPAAAAAYLTNRNRNKTGQNSIDNSNGRNSDDLLQPSNKQKLQNAKAAVARDLRTPGEIFFVRSRMFYSKPAYNAHGEVLFGLRHIHVLNRFSDANVRSHTVHILKHIFPRQFDLHNVFTSKVDRKETVHAFKDYTLREQEIAAVNKGLKPGTAENVPKRLRGTAFELVARMQKLHKRCSYHALVKYYCPAWLCDEGVPDRRITILKDKPSNPVNASKASDSGAKIVEQKEAFADFASTSGEVSAFARAVVENAIPRDFWGKGEGGETNKKIVMYNVDRFVKLRRFETFSLHEVMQKLKLTEFDWLRPPSTSSSTNLSFSDTLKRRELLAEFLYWFFDSFLIPLLRAHFYITESNVHRNRIFYFRHDVWRKLAEPVLNRFKTDMFVELKTERAKKVLDQRKLGFAQVRLLPKELGVRPIMNLRRRELKIDKWKGRSKGKLVLGPSINSIMTPVHNILSFEKTRKADKVGSSMGSVAEIYLKLKSFQTRLKEKGWLGRKLYFAKVDIKSCFDTIPQKRLLKVIEDIITEDEYRIEKYAEIKPPAYQQTIVGAKKPIKKFLARANLADEFGRFEDYAKSEVEGGKKKNTVFVDDVVHQFKETGPLLDLLEEHVQHNIIKIGKKFFRQKNGIPQGSVLSATLCNFFYGDLERKKLPFTLDEDGILLRLVDDFLFITLNKSNAEEFLNIMHQGHPEYGAFVSIDKTLVNFEVSLGGRKVNRSASTSEFPYCGNLVNMKTLGVRKDRDRGVGTNVNDLLTVDYSKGAGRGLHRKAVSAFKILTHPMYYDTEFNGYQEVLKNIYHSFMEAAMKFHRAVKALTGSKQPSGSFIIKVISDLLELAVVMLKNSIGKSHRIVTGTQIRWLGAQGFKKILGRKQTNYRELLKWLDNIIRNEKVGGMATKISFLESDPFQSFRY